MKRSDETKKELAVAATGVAGAAAAVVAGPVVGTVAAIAAPVIALGVGVGFITLRNRDEKRAAKLLERLILDDESPEEFAQHVCSRLEAEDDEFTSAFRHLLITTVEAATPKALGAMAVLGRRYLRSDCSHWLARGGLRALAECTEMELESLGLFVAMVASYPDRRAHSKKGMTRVGMYVADGVLHEARTAEPRLTVGTCPPDHRRVFRLLKMHGLAETITDVPDGVSGADTIAVEISVAAELSNALVQGRSPLHAR